MENVLMTYSFYYEYKTVHEKDVPDYPCEISELGFMMFKIILN